MSLEWQDVVLKDVLSEKGYIRGPFGSALKRSEMKSEGIPVYEQQNAIYDNRIFRYYIDEDKYQSLKRFTTVTDDLIISCSGTVGKVSIIKENDPKGIISQALLTLRVNKKLILPEFLKYFFSSYEGYNSLVSRSTGSVQVNISKRAVIEEIPLKLPPLDIQKNIVYYLQLIDAKIENCNSINKNLLQLSKVIFKNWFVEFGPFGGTQPENWRISTLEEVCDLKAGGDKPNVVSDEITDTCIYPIYSNGLDKDGLYGYTDQAKIFEESVTVSARGTIGFVCLRHIPYVPIVRLVSVIPKKEFISAKYLYLFLDRLNIMGTGTTQQQLTIPDFKKTEILVPTLDVIESFTNHLKPIFEKIWIQEDEIKKLSKLRDTLLPKLMSGEIDVSKINCDLEL